MADKDPSQNFIHEFSHPLTFAFQPRSVAIVGAKDTAGSVGNTIMTNLIAGSFKGKIYPINPKRKDVLGLICYPSLLDILDDIDLAVIVTPAQFVPAIMRECAQKKVKSCVIISAGFKEIGPAGKKLEQEVLQEAKKGNVRVIGPNCLGIMNPLYGLNASFAKGMASAGSLAFISQSGAMCTAVLDWSLQQNVGFSSFISIGSMSDVDWGDLIEYFGKDRATRAILIYMETVGNPRAFMSAAREVALDKPIIVIKPGKSSEAKKAAASHTGSLSGSDDIFDAGCERAGVLRVQSISQLFSMAEVLACQPRPQGPRLAIVTNAGGPSVLATDSAIENGAQLAQLSQNTIETLHQFLPQAWSRANPVDILGDATAERYEKTVDILVQEETVDGVLVILSPQDMTDAKATSKALATYSKMETKPILASWMGGKSVDEGRRMLHSLHIPCFDYPDEAAWSFATMWRYSKLIDSLYKTPLSDLSHLATRKAIKQRAHSMLNTIRTSGRTLLTEEESKELLSMYGIRVVQTIKATSLSQAVEAAQTIGYPVVVKLHSHTITHKSDVGGVQLNIQSKEAVESAFHLIRSNVLSKYNESDFQGVTIQKMIDRGGVELIVGSSYDSEFGPIILFGAGGVYVEVMKDRALGLPPLNSTHAHTMIAKTKIAKALGDFRGKKAVSLDTLADVIVRFSELITEHSSIIESDINPLMASHEEIIALDARFVLAPQDIGASVATGKTKEGVCACRPYPIEYVSYEYLKNGEHILIRPIRAEDEPLLVTFHHNLSEKSVRQRYFEFISLDARVTHDRLLRICFSDFDREITLIAQMPDSSLQIDNGEKVHEQHIGGVIRLVKLSGTARWDLKLIIIDRYQGKGLGKALMKQALSVCAQEKVKEICAYVLEENVGMISLLKSSGFTMRLVNEHEKVKEFILTLS